MRRARVGSVVVLLASFLVAGSSSAAPPRPHAKARAFLADVVLEVDDLGRYVVLVDSDRNGSVDHALIYETTEPLPEMAPRFEEGARLEYGGDGGPRRVEVSRWIGAGPRQLLVEIDLDLRVDRGQRSSGGERFGGGVALAMLTGYSLWPGAEGSGPEALRVRGLPTFAEAETEHVRTSRLAIEPFLIEACGCKQCSAGGPGATTCSVKCSGRVVMIDIGEDCSTQCGPNLYACCSCTGLLGAFGRCECVRG